MIPILGWLGARSAKLGVVGAVTLALGVATVGCFLFDDGGEEPTPTPAG